MAYHLSLKRSFFFLCYSVHNPIPVSVQKERERSSRKSSEFISTYFCSQFSSYHIQLCMQINKTVNISVHIHNYKSTNMINNKNLLHLYSAFLGTQIALHRISSNPLGWCNGNHIASERPPHTSLLVERRQWWSQSVDMGMIRRPWWSEANGEIWPGHRGNTLTLFRRTSWDF